MNQSQFPAITCNSLKAWEESRAHGAIGFGLASHWLKNWRESFKPITKRNNRNHAITFDSHLKTALTLQHLFYRLRYIAPAQMSWKLACVNDRKKYEQERARGLFLESPNYFRVYFVCNNSF